MVVIGNSHDDAIQLFLLDHLAEIGVPGGLRIFGGALFETLRRIYGTDRIRFTFVSDEVNGVTKDQFGNTRPLIPRTFETLSQAEDENGQSRIYLGIHWRFDKVNGIRQGEQIADVVTDTLFLPR